MPIDARLLDLLRCPACRGVVRPHDHEQGLLCASCGRLYPIVDGIPVMLVDEARLSGIQP
jgi:hypothetical protein